MSHTIHSNRPQDKQEPLDNLSPGQIFFLQGDTEREVAFMVVDYHEDENQDTILDYVRVVELSTGYVSLLRDESIVALPAAGHTLLFKEQ